MWKDNILIHQNQVQGQRQKQCRGLNCGINKQPNKQTTLTWVYALSLLFLLMQWFPDSCLFLEIWGTIKIRISHWNKLNVTSHWWLVTNHSIWFTCIFFALPQEQNNFLKLQYHQLNVNWSLHQNGCYKALAYTVLHPLPSSHINVIFLYWKLEILFGDIKSFKQH